jgi:hypothetical protein
MGLRGAEVFPFGGMTPLWRIERTLMEEKPQFSDHHFYYAGASIQ